jgi:hypothetical protein
VRTGLQLSDLVERPELFLSATELSKRYASLEGGRIQPEKFANMIVSDASISAGKAGF